MRYVMSVERDLAAVRADEARAAVEHRRFPGAVRPDQPRDASCGRVDGRAVDGDEPAEGDANVLHVQRACRNRPFRGFALRFGARRFGALRFGRDRAAVPPGLAPEHPVHKRLDGGRSSLRAGRRDRVDERGQAEHDLQPVACVRVGPVGGDEGGSDGGADGVPRCTAETDDDQREENQ